MLIQIFKIDIILIQKNTPKDRKCKRHRCNYTIINCHRSILHVYNKDKEGFIKLLSQAGYIAIYLYIL